MSLNSEGERNCHNFQDMKEEYVNIRLKSFYIPDINEKKYPRLYQLIVQLLQRKIVPMYVKSITKSTLDTCTYHGRLYKWCQNKKQLNIIIKCQQYNYNPSFNKDKTFDYEISYNSHIEGTEIEKISHVGIVYLDIDNNIQGGNLVLSFDHYKRNTWKYKTKTGSIILFPNMSHKIDPIDIWPPAVYSYGRGSVTDSDLNLNENKNKNKNKNKNEIEFKDINYRRRILTFWFCDNDNESGFKQFKQTQAFAAMKESDERYDQIRGDSQWNIPNDHIANWRPSTEYLVDSIQTLTALDILPLDKNHYNDLLTVIVSNILNATIVKHLNLPEQIVWIIVDYMNVSNKDFLRDNKNMQSNANSFRNFRRNWSHFNGNYGAPLPVAD